MITQLIENGENQYVKDFCLISGALYDNLTVEQLLSNNYESKTRNKLKAQGHIEFRRGSKKTGGYYAKTK